MKPYTLDFCFSLVFHVHLPGPDIVLSEHLEGFSPSKSKIVWKWKHSFPINEIILWKTHKIWNRALSSMDHDWLWFIYTFFSPRLEAFCGRSISHGDCVVFWEGVLARKEEIAFSNIQHAESWLQVAWLFQLNKCITGIWIPCKGSSSFLKEHKGKYSSPSFLSSYQSTHKKGNELKGIKTTTPPILMEESKSKTQYHKEFCSTHGRWLLNS